MSLSPAPPQTFELPPSDAVQLAFIVGAISLGLGVIAAFVFGFAFLVLTVGTGPALFFLLSGVPEALEVHADRVVIRYALKRERVIPASELMLQRLPGELMLVHGNDSFVLDEELFGPGLIEPCGEALAKIAQQVVERRETRARR